LDDCTSYAFELLAYDVVDDMAYTAGFEHSSVSVDGQPRTYALRATQVYRREGGHWRLPIATATPSSSSLNGHSVAIVSRPGVPKWDVKPRSGAPYLPLRG
jgi:hypothetical protein